MQLHAPVKIAGVTAEDAAVAIANSVDPKGLHLVFADPYNLKDLALFSTWLTIAATVVSFLVAGIRGGPEAFSLRGLFASCKVHKNLLW